jgi:F-type H+-transporting ATPase subunit epsilon
VHTHLHVHLHLRRALAVAKLFQVELVSVDAKVWSGEAEMVVARTTEGELGVLAGHEPLLGQLAEPGQVRIIRPEGELAYEVNGGFLSISDEGVTVLAESAQPVTPSAGH